MRYYCYINIHKGDLSEEEEEVLESKNPEDEVTIKNICITLLRNEYYRIDTRPELISTNRNDIMLALRNENSGSRKFLYAVIGVKGGAEKIDHIISVTDICLVRNPRSDKIFVFNSPINIFQHLDSKSFLQSKQALITLIHPFLSYPPIVILILTYLLTLPELEKTFEKIFYGRHKADPIEFINSFNQLYLSEPRGKFGGTFAGIFARQITPKAVLAHAGKSPDSATANVVKKMKRDWAKEQQQDNPDESKQVTP